MTISLGGTEGPDLGGLTTMAGRAVQEIAKPDARVADVPPAAKPPEMVEPERAAKPLPTPARPVASRPMLRGRGRRPPVRKSRPVRPRVNTGAPRFRSAAWHRGAAQGVQLDVKELLLSRVLTQMVQKIRSNWNANRAPAGSRSSSSSSGATACSPTSNWRESSGQALLDLEARRAVHKTMQLPPLPQEFPDSSLTIHLTFDFQR